MAVCRTVQEPPGQAHGVGCGARQRSATRLHPIGPRSRPTRPPGRAADPVQVGPQHPHLVQCLVRQLARVCIAPSFHSPPGSGKMAPAILHPACLLLLGRHRRNRSRLHRGRASHQQPGQPGASLPSRADTRPEHQEEWPGQLSIQEVRCRCCFRCQDVHHVL